MFYVCFHICDLCLHMFNDICARMYGDPYMLATGAVIIKTETTDAAYVSVLQCSICVM